MAYIKTVWQAEEGTQLNRFQKTNETTGYVTLTRAPGSITQAGTVFSTTAMNNIEDEIESISNLAHTFSGIKTFSNRVLINTTDNGVDWLQLNGSLNILNIALFNSSAITMYKPVTITHALTSPGLFIVNSLTTDAAYIHIENNESKGIDVGVGGSVHPISSIASRSYVYSGATLGLSLITNSLTEDIRFYQGLSNQVGSIVSGRFVWGGTDNGVDKLQVNGSTLLQATPSFGVHIGGASFSWNNSDTYPTLYGTDNDRWLMIVHPHIPYTKTGYRGYTGGIEGSLIRFEEANNGVQTTAWSLGLNPDNIFNDYSAFGLSRGTDKIFSATSSVITMHRRLSVISMSPTDNQNVSIRTYDNNPSSWKGGIACGYTSASVIMGELNGVAQIGGHTSTLNGWMPLAINGGGGNVLIGTTTDNGVDKLQVNGSAYISGGVKTDGQYKTQYNYGTYSIATTEQNVYDELISWVTNVGDKMDANGILKYQTTYGKITGIARTATDQVLIYFIDLTTSQSFNGKIVSDGITDPLNIEIHAVNAGIF